MGRALTPMTSRTTPPTPVFCRAAEGLGRGGMVVGLYLESQVRVLVEGDDACIIDKG